jgi:hypothetical protein
MAMPTIASQTILRAIVDERRRALSRSLHRVRPQIPDPVERLRDEAEAYRAQAIVLNAKLRALESANDELRALRARLAASTARLDNAVTAIVQDVRDVLVQRLAELSAVRRPRASLRR